MSKRVSITLDAETLAAVAWAGGGEPVGRVAAEWVRERAAGEAPAVGPARGPARPERQRWSPRTGPASTARAPWLEPLDESRVSQWREEIYALVRRLVLEYELSIRDRWWERRRDRDQLAALALWRRELDSDPEAPLGDELVWHRELNLIEGRLAAPTGGTEPAYDPQMPPPSWVRQAAPRPL